MGENPVIERSGTVARPSPSHTYDFVIDRCYDS
jgi:hypothetical protein